MSSDNDQSSGEHYRDVADRLRRLARQTRVSDVRQELFDLAEGFERIAEFADKSDTAERPL